MSDKEFAYNLYLLENLRIYGEEALIEADKLEYLSKDGKWESFSNLGLLYVPIIIKTSKIKNDNLSSRIYELTYKLLIPNVEIAPSRIERIILHQTNEDETYSKQYQTIKNKFVKDAVIRYNNEKTNTFSKVKDQEVMLSFIKKSRQDLYRATGVISENITQSKKLTLRK